MHLGPLLRPAGGWRGEQAARERTYERPTLHYSITSSARASSDGGTVRARTLAVLRLTTTSNFVGRARREDRPVSRPSVLCSHKWRRDASGR